MAATRQEAPLWTAAWGQPPAPLQTGGPRFCSGGCDSGRPAPSGVLRPLPFQDLFSFQRGELELRSSPPAAVASERPRPTLAWKPPFPPPVRSVLLPPLLSGRLHFAEAVACFQSHWKINGVSPPRGRAGMSPAEDGHSLRSTRLRSAQARAFGGASRERGDCSL